MLCKSVQRAWRTPHVKFHKPFLNLLVKNKGMKEEFETKTTQQLCAMRQQLYELIHDSPPLMMLRIRARLELIDTILRGRATQ